MQNEMFGKEITVVENNDLIPVYKRTIGDNEVNSINAKDLYNFLEVKTKFNDWITRRIEEYDFINDIDYLKMSKSNYIGIGKAPIDYIVSIDMAKEICMVEKTEKGKQARKYFIEIEKKAKEIFNLPDFKNPVLMARIWADNYEKINLLEDTIKEQEPKVVFVDKITESNDYITIGEFAKVLQDKKYDIGQNRLFEWLKQNKFLQKNNLPYQVYLNQNLFKVIEKFCETKNGIAINLQTVITPKGTSRIN